MELEKFKKNLLSCDKFRNITKWKFKWIPHGGVSPHTYIISKDKVKYFVKEINNAEKAILTTLNKIKEVKISPKIIALGLLDKNILVQECITGGHPKSKNIQPQLIVNFAKLQNILNAPNYKKRLNKYNGCKYSYKDDGFFKKWINGDFDADSDLKRLKKVYGLPVVDKYLHILKHVRQDRKNIVKDYANMPFAILHNDFKEDNIVGKPQKLVDWGSFYAYGPFLNDLSPFLAHNKKNYEIFIRTSDICKEYDRAIINRWLYVALCSRFLSLLKWRLKIGGYFKDKKECKKFLEYEYKTYKYLLE